MRPIKLVMTAFGPYKGKEVIDFEELNHEQLFLITGPTGAGKTTIFDAISFALYGKTSGDYRPENSVRCQNAEDDVITEVSLQFHLKGKEYFIRREPKQLMKKKRGEGYREVGPKAEVYALGDDQPITGATNVNDYIEALMGLKVDQFRQIMMIPQGEFRKLLMAGSDERTEILKKLFKTNLYETIQKKIKDDAKFIHDAIQVEEQERNQWLQSIILDEDDDALHQMIHAEDPHVEKIMEGLHEKIKTDQEKLDQIKVEEKALKDRLHQAIEERSKAENVNQLFADLKHQTSKYEALQAKDKEIASFKETISYIHKAKLLAPKAKRVGELSYALAELKGQEDSVKKDLSINLEAYQKVDQGIKHFEKPEVKEEISNLETKVISLRQWLPNVEDANGKKDKLLVINEHIHKAKEDLQLAQEDERKLNERLSSLTQKLAEYQDLSGEKERLSAEIDNLNRIRNEALVHYKGAGDYEIRLKDLMSFKKHMEEEKVKLDLKEQMTLKTQQNYHLNQAAILASKLKDDQACPVCGSKDHPQLAIFSGEQVSEDDVKKAQEALQVVSKDYQKEALQLSKLESGVDHDKQILDQYLESIQQALEAETYQAVISRYGKSLRAKIDDKEKHLSGVLKAMKDHQELMDEQKIIQEKMEKATLQMTDLQNQVNHLEKDRSVLTAACETLLKDIPSDQQDIKLLRESLDQAAKLHGQMVEESESLRKQFQRLSEEKVSLETKLASLNSRKVELENDLSKHQEALSKGITNDGFASHDDFRAYLDKEEELNHLEETVKAHDQDLHLVNGQIKDLESKTKDQVETDLSNFDGKIQSYKEEETKLQTSHMGLSQALDQHGKISNRVSELTALIADKEEKIRSIGQVAKVINGDNSKRIKLETYVLASYLRDILKVANQRLHMMTSHRYSLKIADQVGDRRKDGGLDLAVDDAYTGLSRSVKTLSGGESFKASLAMALALAEVVQSHAGGIQLDTVFIDEGFGTLDQESLDQAINCLMKLQDSGRLVGIISHVNELKERIGTKLIIDVDDETSRTRFELA